MAMLDLACSQNETPVSLGAISMRQHLPLPYLEQLFSRLRQSKLVQSSRGSSGGYQLARPPHQIPIYEIIMAVDKPLQATRCHQSSSMGCQGGADRCLPHDLWKGLETVIHDFLNRVTLEDVCQRRVPGNKIGAFTVSEFCEHKPCL